MTIVLITTTDLQTLRPDELSRLAASVAAQRAERPDIRIHHLLLVQRSPADGAYRLPFTPQPHDFVLPTPDRLSLSAARNRLLAEARRQDLLAGAAIVAFPDDDAWYPPRFLSLLHDRFGAMPALDFWFCRYASVPAALGDAVGRTASLGDVLRRASSNTMVLRGSLVAVLPPFDERLGVGAALPGGEDTEYALAAWSRARETEFLDEPCVGHRDFTPALRAKYFGPALAAILSHALHPAPGKANAIRLQAARKLAVGLAYAARGTLPPGKLGRDVAAAWRFARQRPLPRREDG